MITPSMKKHVESVASISKQIKGIKDALKASEQDPFYMNWTRSGI
ncbi:MAG: hypothetical protein CM15mV22_2440 [Eurybiavirus sp.]|nr:MAG: hypothetical protein CM15mV22_2440 [Eurybiavirus sp.]